MNSIELSFHSIISILYQRRLKIGNQGIVFPAIFGRLFIYNKNINGPNTKSCWTPHVTFLVTELILSQKTNMNPILQIGIKPIM